MQFLTQAAFIPTTENRLIVLQFQSGPIRDAALLELQRVIRFPDEVDAFIKTADTHYTDEAWRKIREQSATIEKQLEQAGNLASLLSGSVDVLRSKLGVPTSEIAPGISTPTNAADTEKKGA